MSRSPVVARRRLGASLKELRLGAELKLEDAANELRCSASKVSRLENGKGVPRERDVRDLLNLYGAAAREAELTQLVVDGLGDGSGSVLDQREGVEKDVVSDDTWRYQELESDAVRILTLERDFIPGLLQTEGYARALVRLFLPDLPDEQVDRFVRLRKQRQVVLERLDAPDARGLELAVVVDERALRRPVGGPEVMAQQLRRLADSLRDDLSAVRFHVAPATLVSPGILRGPFSVLGFADELDQDVVFLEADDHPTYLETDDHVQRYEAVFESLVKECLDSAESIALLDRIAKAMESEVAADAVS